MPALVPAPTADPDWSIGDSVIAAIAAGAHPDFAKREAARDARREETDVTWAVRTCEAFPPDQRRADLPFALHRAVIDLAPDERGAMLDKAAAEGWSARQTRRAVLDARIAVGDFFPAVDDDLEDKQYRRIAQAWNRASVGARELFAGSIEDADLAEIAL